MAAGIACGVDVGSLSAQAVLMRGEQIVGTASARVLPAPVDSARRVVEQACRDAGLAPGQLHRTVATGYGRQQLVEHGLAAGHVSEISCHGAGAQFLLPGTRTVIDIGGQDAKVIALGERGEVADFVMNDKCASGTGRFLEAMARTIGVPLEELGPLARRAPAALPLSSRCSIFCETEVLHQLQRGAEPAPLAAGVTEAMAERAAALARRVPRVEQITMTGGVAKNAAVVAGIERRLQLRMIPLPRDAQLAGAVGAALFAAGRRVGHDS